MKNIFVGNLDFEATEDQLRSLFGSHGTVEKVTLVRDQWTHHPRGFAFVEMTNDVEAELAIKAINGGTLNGRNLNVDEARLRPARSGGDHGFRDKRVGSGGAGRGRY